MNEKLKEKYIAWMNDAYAMEKNIEEMLEKQADAAKDYPDIFTGIQQHLDETRSHAEKIKDCIERNDGEISNVKSALSQVMGNISSLMTDIMPDTIVKAVIADYAVEHFEIASYRALGQVATKVGDTETIQVVEEIIRDEQEMAEWIEGSLPTVVDEYIDKEQ